MSRLTWFTAGAVTGVYAILKARSTARNFTPDGIAARAAALAAGLRVFTSEVSEGMAERESELRRPPTAVPPLIEPAHLPTQTRNEQMTEELDGADGHR